MTRLPAVTDWEEVYARPTLYRPDCWQGCSSYCCTWDGVFQNFSFLGKQGTDLFLFPGEMEFLRDGHHFQPGFAESLAEIPIELGSDRRISFYKVTCGLRGMCADHQYRPVICRTYPAFPVVDEGGRVIGLEPFSLFDVLLDLRGMKSICTIGELSLAEIHNVLRFWDLLLRDPSHVFFFMAASRYKRQMARTIKEKYPAILQDDAQLFFQKWEKLFLFGKLVDKKALIAELAAIHDEILRRHRDA